MSQRLSRAKREAIIIDYLNKKETPGYEVKENANGKFIVKAIAKPVESPPTPPKIEIEEEEAVEEVEPSLEENGLEPIEIETPTRQQRASGVESKRSKQNAKELLKQLQQLLIEENDEDDELVDMPPSQGQFIERRYNPGPQNWKRRKLVLG